MRKGKWILFVVMLTLICSMLAACDMFSSGSGGDKPAEQQPSNDTWTEVSNAEGVVVYTQLLKSLQNTLKDVSDESVTDASPKFSLDTKFSIKINGIAYTLSAKVKYDKKNLDDVKIAVELTQVSNSKLIIGAYYGVFSDNIDPCIYVKIFDGESGKLKFTLSEDNGVAKFFPIKNFSTSDISNIATIIEGIVTKSGNITGKTRKNGTVSECEYTFKINLTATLKSIAGMLTHGTGNVQDALNSFLKTQADKNAANAILAKLFGMTLDDLSNAENLPASTLSVNFASSSDKLTDFGLGVTVSKLSGSASATSLFGGKAINLSLDMDNLTVTKDSALSIPFFGNNEYKEYKNFLNKSDTLASDISKYGIRLNVKDTLLSTEEVTDYDLTAEFSLHETDVAQTKLKFEMYNPDKQENDVGIYYLDRVLYIYGLDAENEYGLLAKYTDFDLINTFDQMKANVSNISVNPLGTLQVVAALVGALQIDETEISFTFNMDLISVFIPDLTEFMTWVEENANLDEGSKLQDVATYLPAHSYLATILLDADNPFVYELQEDIEMPDYLPI